MLHNHLCATFPECLWLSQPTYCDLDSPSVRAWGDIYKRLILCVEKYDVYGSWDEILDRTDKTHKFNGPVLASEFFLLWPFIVGTLNYMPMARRENFEKAIKRSAAKVVRGLVKYFNLCQLGYPINFRDKKPLLNISKKLTMIL